MKIGDISLWLTTWMSRLDRLVSFDRCCTNPFLATFLLYVFLVMGVMRDASSTVEVFESLDDVYDFMLPQNEGLGLMCLVFMGTETIMLCGGIADILTRFAIIIIFANLFYLAGLFLPIVSQMMLGILAFAYIYMFTVIAGDTYRHIRKSLKRTSDPEE